MRKTERELFEKYLNLKFDTLIKELNNFREESKHGDTEIIKHQKIANGRIVIIEDETKFIRWVFRKPRRAIISILLAVGLSGAILYCAIIYIGMDNIIRSLIHLKL